MVSSRALAKLLAIWWELNHLLSLARRWSRIGTVIVLLKYSEGVEAWVFGLWCWRPHILGIDATLLHISVTVINHSLWWESIFSLTFLRDDRCQYLNFRNCLDYNIFSLLLKAASETKEVMETLIGDHQGTDKISVSHGKHAGEYWHLLRNLETTYWNL